MTDVNKLAKDFTETAISSGKWWIGQDPRTRSVNSTLYAVGNLPDGDKGKFNQETFRAVQDSFSTSDRGKLAKLVGGKLTADNVVAAVVKFQMGSDSCEAKHAIEVYQTGVVRFVCPSREPEVRVESSWLYSLRSLFGNIIEGPRGLKPQALSKMDIREK